MALIKCSHLSKSYGKHMVLKDISLAFGPGKITGLLGPNGQGKSTLIKILCGLVQADAGSVSSSCRISYLPERCCLDRSWKVSQLLDFYSDFYWDFDRERAESLLAALGIDLPARLSSMSKGMQEKVQLVLVMCRNADLYILDEPLGGVDPASRDVILDTILSSLNEGSSLLISTHLVSDIERILDDVILLDQGGVDFAGSADELRQTEGMDIDGICRRKFKCF